MKLKDAIQRLQWRFSQGKAFTPNPNDIEALNGIIEYINGTVKKEVNENEMFAKLYVKILTDYLTCLANDVDASQKAINQTLQKPLIQLYDEFRSKYNGYAFNDFLLANGIPDKHPLLYNESEEEKNKFSTTHKDWNLYANGILDKDENEMQLNWIITLTLNHFKNV